METSEPKWNTQIKNYFNPILPWVFFRDFTWGGAKFALPMKSILTL